MTAPFAALARTHAACFFAEKAWDAPTLKTVLARLTSRLIGDARSFAILSIVGDEAEILTLATHPDHRRQGYAAQVLNACAAQHRHGVRRIFLEVDASNSAAIALYETAGYHRAGCRKGYYRHADGTRGDALILRQDLTQWSKI